MAYPKENNDPELLEIKTKDDGIEKLKLKIKTEKHDQENILKSLKIDKE